MDISTEIIGLSAGILTTLAFLPQLLKVWRNKTAKDISLLSFIMFTTGVVLWCTYGFMLQARPIIIANIITFAIAASILFLKVIYDRKS